METIQTEEQFNCITEDSKFFYTFQTKQADILIKYLRQDCDHTVQFVEGFIQILNSDPRNKGIMFNNFGYLVKRLYREPKSSLVREIITNIQAIKMRRNRVKFAREKVIESINKMRNNDYFDKEKLEKFSKNIKKIVKNLLIHKHDDENGDGGICMIEYYDRIL